MLQPEAMTRSISESCSLSSSGTILREHRPPSSLSFSEVTCLQRVATLARTSSSSHVLFDRPFQLFLSTRDAIHYDAVVSFPSPLGVPATSTSSLSCSFAINGCTTSRVVAIRRDDSNGDNSSETNDDEDTAATPATVSVMVTITPELTYPTTTTLGNTNTESVQPLSTVSVMVTITPEWTYPTTVTLGSTSTGSVQPSPTVSVMVAITPEWTYPTKVTLGNTSTGSVQPSPTGPVASALSTSKSSLRPLILGLVFGLVFLIALAVVIHKFCSRLRRQAELLPQLLSGDRSQEPVATPATLERRPRAPPLVRRVSDWRSRCRSQGDSSEPMSEVLSDPFTDGFFAVSSRTSEPEPNGHLIFGENFGTLHSSDNSELNILAPIPSNAGTSTHFSYLSPTGHYRERHTPPATSAEDTLERSSLVFHAGSGRLRASLDEARRT